MKNLMSRDEYLQSTNEGFIKDTVKKGIEKVKNFFRVGMKKIKNFIAVFDKDGNIAPVITPQEVIDRFSGSENIKVYAGADMNKSVEDAGGKGCETKAPEVESDEIYDEGPDGDEYAEWLADEKYKDSVEYKNFMSIPSIIKENYDNMTDENKKLFENFIEESWKDVQADRVHYKKGDHLKELRSLTTEKFEKLLDKLIDERIFNEDGLKESEMSGNILVFGAPGIGKSTIPNMVVGKYNEGVESSRMLSLITVDCPNIAVGDFMMPTVPTERDIKKEILAAPDTFPQAKEWMDGLNDEQNAQLDKILGSTLQYTSHDAPKSWLPTYQKSGDDATDRIYDMWANSGVYTDANGVSHKTGNGGIIMFDEFLRSDPNVFKQLMVFLLTRQFGEWVLGSKWVIIGCSNRPVDDDEVLGVWNSWNGGPAGKDRFAKMYHLEPDPEGWKKWARKKNCDELLLKFIFDEHSKTADGEYPRWHSMLKQGEEGAQVLPITPRRWASAIAEINKFERRNHIDDISQMSIDDIDDTLGGIFDESFLEELKTWLEDNMNSVSLDAIIEDPVNTYLPKKFAAKKDGENDDEAGSSILVKNLLGQFKDKFKEHPEECTDEVLTNIIIWFGLNYPYAVNDVFSVFISEVIGKIIPNEPKEKSFFGRIKANMMFRAAWPETDLAETCTDNENADACKWPENSLEIIKGYMKKYFPWRLDGDEIKYINDYR